MKLSFRAILWNNSKSGVHELVTAMNLVNGK